MTGVEDRVCLCPTGAAARYGARISGPLRDRIDLWVMLPRVPPAQLLNTASPESSATVAARIAFARRLQQDRQSGRLNAKLGGRALAAVARTSPSVRRRLVELAELEDLSARGTERMLRVARTIADLAGCAAVASTHLEEAARFRSPARHLAEQLAG